MVFLLKKRLHIPNIVMFLRVEEESFIENPCSFLELEVFR